MERRMLQAIIWWKNANQTLRDEKGQGMVEYGLILALVVVVGMVGMALIGTDIALVWPNITTALAAAV